MVVLKKLGLRQSFNKMKFSLAVADFLTGVQLLVVSIYNFSWSMNVSSMELDQRQLLLTGTPEATVGGILLLLTFTSSLYHLVYMGGQRLYSMRWPVSYRFQSSLHIYVGLAVVWLLALTSSTVPAWFPDCMVYTYQHTIFLFYITNTYYSGQSGNFNVLIAMMICFVVVPYIIMTCSAFVTLYSVRDNMKKSKELKHVGSANQKGRKINKLENQMCITVALMQLGFTITMIPLVVFNALFYGNSLTCDTGSLPFLFCFYLSMSNSLVNMTVYSFRNKAFAKKAKETLAMLICCARKEDKYLQASNTSRNTTATQVQYTVK
uniref:Relaxin receptor 2 n=1 Tax=Phallusia mammillata TaxID=59560 RepID=A0A6F9DS59_9ASCI|nr:relaxin receptor 2 [Phallusia mammillata]